MNKILKISIITIIIILTGCTLIPKEKDKQAQTDYLNNKNNLECIYYEPVDFVNIKQFDLNNDVGRIYGAILPHHLVASDLIHEVFQNIKTHDYETVVLIGPDHESLLMGKIFTTLKNWQTPMGVLETDSTITKKLLKNSFIVENDDKLTLEHSTSGIVPFIKYYLKDVKIVTLVITKQTKLEDIDKVIEDLSNLVNKDKTLFISSVDFSHYLNLDHANKMDLISIKAIENRDINKIMLFTNDNLDSPVSIVAIIKMMDKLDVSNLKLLNHSNTELILKESMKETTSYLTYLYY